MKIALVQFLIDHKDKGNNWSRIETYLAQAAQQKVDLIVFPEFFLGGPGKRSAIVDAPQRLGALAKKYEMDIVPGTVIEQDNQGQYKNTAYYIDKFGQVLLKYDKVHLWQQERRYLKQGDFTFGTVITRFGVTVGLCACWDLSVPEIFREMAMNGNAQLIIVPAYWTADEQEPPLPKYDVGQEVELLNSLCAARAFENSVCVAFCNAAQQSSSPSSTLSSSPFGLLTGASQIAVPFRGAIAHTQGDHECMLVKDVDVISITEQAKRLYGIHDEWQAGRIFTSNNGSTSKL